MRQDIYEITQEAVALYSGRFKLHKSTSEIYFDDNIFDMPRFRKLVLEEHEMFLENDQYIYEIVRFEAEKNKFSPIESYLEECLAKHEKIDCKATFRQLFEKCLYVDPDSIEAKYISKTLTAAVARIHDPGIKFDQVLVFIGDQGFLKTSFFENLVGEENFASITLGKFDKDEQLTCHSKWMIELGEVEETITKTQMGKLKQFITRRSDTFRKPYDRHTVTLKRSFILVGSTNKEEFLVDETGNRRFWCVPISKKIDLDWLKENRDLVWAAAVKSYLDNHPIYLNEVEQEASNRRNRQYRKEEPWTSTIESWVKQQTQPFTITEAVSKALKKEVKSIGSSDQTRVKNILKQLGLEPPKKTSRVKGGIPGRYWYPKEKAGTIKS